MAGVTWRMQPNPYPEGYVFDEQGYRPVSDSQYDPLDDAEMRFPPDVIKGSPYGPTRGVHPGGHTIPPMMPPPPPPPPGPPMGTEPPASFPWQGRVVGNTRASGPMSAGPAPVVPPPEVPPAPEVPRRPVAPRRATPAKKPGAYTFEFDDDRGGKKSVTLSGKAAERIYKKLSKEDEKAQKELATPSGVEKMQRESDTDELDRMFREVYGM